MQRQRCDRSDPGTWLAHSLAFGLAMGQWSSLPHGLQCELVCRDHDYHNFLFSMKASNPLVMVQAYRLLAEEMYLKGWDYPLHLGVTEVLHWYSGRQAVAPTPCLARPPAL